MIFSLLVLKLPFTQRENNITVESFSVFLCVMRRIPSILYVIYAMPRFFLEFVGTSLKLLNLPFELKKEIIKKSW